MLKALSKDPNLLVEKKSFEIDDKIPEGGDIFDFIMGNPADHEKLTEEQFNELEIKGNKQLRVYIQDVLNKVEELPRTRERSLVYTKLQEAKMWVGQDLMRLREKGIFEGKHPYPEGDNPSNTIIYPTVE